MSRKRGYTSDTGGDQTWEVICQEKGGHTSDTEGHTSDTHKVILHSWLSA